MNTCEKCIHAEVCYRRQYPALYAGDCEHYKTESPAYHTLRLIYADFMYYANRCKTKAEGCSMRGKPYDAADFRRQAEIGSHLAYRMQRHCFKIGFDPSQEVGEHK